MKRLGLLVAWWLPLGPAATHPSSTAYLHATAEGRQLSLQADYALADLDDALTLDADADGHITWGEVQAAAPAVLGYLTPRLSVRGDDRDCPLVARPGVQIRQRVDGPYAVWQFSARCTQAPARWRVESAALFERDSHHRVVIRLSLDGREYRATLSPRQRAATLPAPR